MRPSLSAAMVPAVVFLCAVYLSSQVQQGVGLTLMISCLLGAGWMLVLPIDWKHPISAKRTSQIRTARFLTVAALSLLYFVASPTIWRRSLASVAARGDVLGDAITRFEGDHSEPPVNLRALVPDYVSVVPETGLGPRRRFRYSTSGVCGDWTLTVPTSGGAFEGDVFKRNSKQLYELDNQAHGEVIAGWLYQID